MEGFRSTLQNCDFSDLGFMRSCFTWEKGRLTYNIQERLDSRVANLGWWHLFPYYSVTHCTHSFLDHYPVLVDTKGQCQRQRLGANNFKFDANWILEELCEKVIR